ncbi:MAG: sulfotransferase [Solirubrobacteraceae bacterium]
MRPLIIGGCPRSGTTLLRSILDNHPEIAIPPETNFVLPLWHQRSGFGDLRRPERRREVAEFVFAPGRGGRRIRGEVSKDEAIDRLVAAQPTLGSLLAASFALYAERTGKPRWGDKRPRYAMYIGVIFDLFPDAQFINVVRDPRGAVASQIPMGWDPPDVALAASIANWEASIERVDAFARRLRPDQLLDVRYEDLVREPEHELTRICAFAGLDADAGVAAALAAPRHGRHLTSAERVTEPVDASAIARWRERLSPADVALIEKSAAADLERFGYLPEAKAAPDRSALAELRRQRQIRRARFRRVAARELARRAVLDRRPVAAAPRADAVAR